MCDQTESIYKDGDIVWVKLASVWWPGVVKDVEKDGLAEELHSGLRSKPFATVQFFDEEYYQFVKTVNDIYYYNCKKKEEFIKKGLDKFRSGKEIMKKFPIDVAKAEELSGGDVNIIKDPKYTPVEKVKEPPPKKEITSEFKTPIKKRVVQKFNSAARASQPRREYQCHVCDFSSDHVGSLTSHLRFSHFSQRVDYGPVVPNRQTQSAPPPKKRIKAKPTPAVEKVKENKHKVPSASSATPVKRTTLLTPEKSMKRYTDALIADWGEDDEEEGPLLAVTEAETSPVPPTTTPAPAAAPIGSNEKEADATQIEPPLQSDENAEKPQSLSCFDFDEDEDAKFIGMSDAITYGRKLPRVIPEKDKSSLGFDPEMDEVFERKKDEEIPVKKRRGRPPKVKKDGEDKEKSAKPTPAKTPKKVVELKETLASTRARRPASRKSYVNEEIRRIDEVRGDSDSSASESKAVQKKSVIHKKRKLERVPSDDDDSSGSEESEDNQVAKKAKPAAKNVKLVKEELEEEWSDDENEDEVETADKIIVRKIISVKATSKPSAKKMKKVESEEQSSDEEELGTEEAAKKRILKALKDNDDDEDDDGIESVTRLLEDSPVEETKPRLYSKTEEETDVPKPSRRKQDLKRSRMVELDDMILPTPTKKVVLTSSEVSKPKLIRVTQKSAPVVNVEESDDLEAQVKSFLAETSAPVVPAALTKPSDQEVMENTVEYLEDEPSPPPPPKTALPISPVKKWKEDIKSALGGESVTIVKKSLIPQWKQGIQEQLKANVTTRVVEKPQTSAIKIVAPSMASRIIKLTGARPKILQNQIVISGARGSTQPKISYIGIKGSKSLVKPTQQMTIGKVRTEDGIFLNFKDGNELSSLQKKALANTYRGGVARIPDYNGTGKEVKLVSLADSKQIVRVKGNDPTKMSQLCIRLGKNQKGQRYFIRPVPKPAPAPQVVTVAEPEPQLVEEQPAVETVQPEPAPVQVPATQQMVYMVQDGNFVLVNVDPNTQQTYTDNSLLTYNVQPEAGEELYQQTAEEPVYQTHTPGQDILAEALANTNVLEEVPLMMPNVVQEPVAGITLQEPYIISPEVPAVHNSACLLTVQENQKPIMTPIEVPSSIVVADAASLEPPPLPPTPDEEVLMEDEGGLMIAEQPAETDTPVDEQPEEPVSEEPTEEVVEESGSFESMPLLNEDTSVAEEVTEGQTEEPNTQAQLPELEETETNEYLPTSTNPDLETELEQPTEGEVYHTSEEKEGVVPYVEEEGYIVSARSQDTEVTSTTDSPT